jgi:predicted metal-binding protein
MLKVGIIRCAIVAEFCPATSCIKAVKEKKGAFEGLDEVELIGFMTCGGCPGKKVSASVKTLLEKGANAIALSSCMTKGYPVGSNAFVCPNLENIKKAVEEFLKKNAPEVKILEWTH